MEVNRLLSDELSYELRVRNAPSTGNVDEKRHRLRLLLRGDSDVQYDISGLDPQLEIQICEAKLDDLESSIDDFDSNNPTNENSKLQTRLRHVFWRLNRISDPTVGLVKVQLLNRCTDLLNSLGLIMHNINHRRSSVQEKSLLDEPNILLPEVVSRTSTSRDQEPTPVANLVDVPSVYMDDQHSLPITIQNQVQYSSISNAHCSSPRSMTNPGGSNIYQGHLPQPLSTSHEVSPPPNMNSRSFVVTQHTMSDSQGQNYLSPRRDDKNNYISSRKTGQNVSFVPTVNQYLSQTPIMPRREPQNMNYNDNLLHSQPEVRPCWMRSEGNPYITPTQPVYSTGASITPNTSLLANHGNTTFHTNNVPQDSFERQIRALNISDTATDIGQQHAQAAVEHSLPVGMSDQARSFSVVSKWNISKFTGFNNVLDFLEEVEELRLACGMSKEQLLRCASTLLTDAALMWFRGIKSSVTTWDELVLLLKDTYLPTDYEKHLLADILARTQHVNEKSALYIAIMENYFNRLKRKPAESERLRIIIDNMLPEIQKQLALQPVNSLSELVEKCKGVEDVFWRAEHWRPPPNNPRVITEANLIYRRPKVHEVEPVHAVSGDPPTAQQTPNYEVSNRVVTCWNCRQQGHVKRDCDKPPSVHCYRCGRQDVTIRTCPSCSGNGPMGHN